MTGRVCNQVAEHHVGPIETGVDSSIPPMLYEQCANCGYVWAISSLSPERAAAMRRALASKARRGGRS